MCLVGVQAVSLWLLRVFIRFYGAKETRNDRSFGNVSAPRPRSGAQRCVILDDNFPFGDAQDFAGALQRAYHAPRNNINFVSQSDIIRCSLTPTPKININIEITMFRGIMPRVITASKTPLGCHCVTLKIAFVMPPGSTKSRGSCWTVP